MTYSPEELKNAVREGEDDLALDLEFLRPALDVGSHGFGFGPSVGQRLLGLPPQLDALLPDLIAGLLSGLRCQEQSSRRAHEAANHEASEEGSEVTTTPITHCPPPRFVRRVVGGRLS